jgi:chemotaxis protein methyltransferase CheR
MDSIENQKSKIKNLENDLLLEAIYRCYGYDFRSYARASIERRIKLFMSSSGCANVSEMIPRVLHDREFFSQLIRYFSIAVSDQTDRTN